tara:strand:- start:2388 stop:3233 length:846 start_codon:yes stop_codon:yes gene_type:complete
MRDNIKRQYTKEWLQFDRPQPMYDKSINKFYDNFYKENPVHNHDLDNIFKNKFIEWLDNHILNSFIGYKEFKYLDICVGCTQFIDDIYQRVGQENVMIFENDYKYHWRLNNNINYTTLDTLTSTKELIIAMPFPYCGDVHTDMQRILDKCEALNIPVHIDGAWISCCRDITFNFNHPAIATFAISLSKGGLGGNRIGIRFSKKRPNGAITIMNDFNMNCQSLVSMGIKFIDTFGAEYFWKQYESKYKKVCKDFNLLPTKTIHLAKTIDDKPVGVRPLLRCL